DDVWSGGSRKDGSYPLMSSAIAAGLYHPSCKDSHTTHFSGISTADDTWTKEELEAIEQAVRDETKQQYAIRQAARFARLTEYSLDPDNRTYYEKKEKQWKSIVKADDSGIMELQRKKASTRGDVKAISEETFNNLTIAARKKGAIIIRGTQEAEEHLERMGAAAANIGDVLIFRREVSISEVLEEVHHFKQNLAKMNHDKSEPLRSILNEIDAKEFLLANAEKYKIPRSETDLTRKQLQSYRSQLEKY
ncbi:MAG: hypothetical protein ACLR9K_02315, partial [Blautia sp.]